MSKRVFRQDERLPIIDLVWQGVLLGLVVLFSPIPTMLPAYFFFPHPHTMGKAVLITFVLICVAGPLLLMRRKRHQIGTLRRAYWAGVGYGIGLTVTPIIAVMVIQEAGIGLKAIVLVVGFLVTQLFGALGAGSWVVIRGSADVVIIQDGTLCPSCGYCLIGNISMICSECGNEYTFSQLGTTAEEFQERSRRTKRE